MDCRYRMAVVAKLAVIVILDDPAFRLSRPSQKGDAALQAQCHPGRILMGRRHIGKTCPGCPLDPTRHTQSVRINRYWNDSGAGRHKCVARSEVTRLFQPDLITRVREKASAQF